MIAFLTLIHILVAIGLCALVLVQDSKESGALGIGGGGGSNSLLGASGAQGLAAKLTRYTAILFAASCIGLTYLLSHENKSVVDQMAAPTALSTNPSPTETNKSANKNDTSEQNSSVDSKATENPSSEAPKQ